MAPLTSSHARAAKRSVVSQRRAATQIRAMALMLEDWLPAFDGAPTAVPTLRDGWRGQEIIEAARRARRAQDG